MVQARGAALRRRLPGLRRGSDVGVDLNLCAIDRARARSSVTGGRGECKRCNTQRKRLVGVHDIRLPFDVVPVPLALIPSTTARQACPGTTVPGPHPRRSYSAMMSMTD